MIILALISALSLGAQRTTFRQYLSADGLTDMTVHCILQDQTGYIWVGTDNGLFRYDGSRFLVFHNEDGLPDSTIRGIAESPGGVLWVTTRGGVARRSGIRFQTVDVGEGGVFRAIAFDRLGRLYLESPSGIIRGVPNGAGDYRFQIVARGAVSGLAVHGEDAWFAKDGDLWHLVGSLAERVGSRAGLPVDRWSFAVEDSMGSLWVESATRLYQLPAGHTSFVDRSAGLPRASLTGLNADSHGRLFVSSEAGVMVLEGGLGTSIDARHGLPADSVNSVLQDREGSLWFGTGGSGLIRQLGGGNWLSWKKEDGLLHNSVWAIRGDRAGQMWVGTGGGLNLIDPHGQVIRSWTSHTGLPGDEVFAIALGPAGDLYAAAYPAGITRFSERGVLLKTYRSASVLAAGWIEAMAVDRDGRLWTTGSAGCFRSRAPLNAGEPVLDRVDIPGMGAGTSFFDVLPDGANTWVGSSRGLALLSDNHWRVWTKRDGLKSAGVAVIARGQGAVWIAYRDALGITRLALDGASTKVTNFTRKDGLASDRIFAIAFDPAGRLWASSDAGIDVLDRESWRHYDAGDGLIWNDTDSLALEADPDGHVWVGTSAGLSRYSPPRYPAANGPPTVVITSIEGALRQWQPADRPALPFRQHSLLLRYSALSYASEDRIRFRYRMVGYEASWTETRERSVHIEGLPAGHYVFQVVAAGPGGMWTPTPAEFAFSIRPPWWQSWWFIAAGLAAAILLLGALWRLRVRVLVAQRKRLERMVDERTAELTESHRQLEEIAYSDMLTGLPNRRYFTQQFRAQLERSGALQERFALLLIDLDSFKQINDTFGHDAGDVVLVQTALRLRAAVRESDCVARFGGDEFAILLFADYEKISIEEICARIVHDSTFGIPFNGSVLNVGACVGIAIYPEDGRSEQVLYKEADLALYEAKQTRSSFCFRPRLESGNVGPRTGPAKGRPERRI